MPSHVYRPAMHACTSLVSKQYALQQISLYKYKPFPPPHPESILYKKTNLPPPKMKLARATTATTIVVPSNAGILRTTAAFLEDESKRALAVAVVNENVALRCVPPTTLAVAVPVA